MPIVEYWHRIISTVYHWIIRFNYSSSSVSIFLVASYL